MASDWHCIPREYEVTKNFLQRYQTYEQHPLKLATVTMVDSKGTRGNPKGSNSSSRTSSSISLLAEPLGMALDGTDPLSQFVRQEQELMDPLTQLCGEYDLFKKTRKTREKNTVLESDALNWHGKRLGILNRFTTSEKLSICTSFLSTGSSGASGGAEIIKCQTVVADKVKYRLEQLDNFEDGSMRHMMDLTQQEYIHRIEQLNQELVSSWHSDQRVKALKIAIQCSKMLADTTVLQFYPSQFVLITDILDIFGKLVFERLHAKAKSGADYTPKLSEDALHEAARETCQNWFYKIASIRELLPRLYVEMALMNCYSFLSQCEFDQALLRITRMIRGVGDVLVATYARCYLVRVGLSVTQNVEFIRENFIDFLTVYHMVNQQYEIFNGSLRSELTRQRIDINTYLALYAPALDFMLQALVHKSNLYTNEILAKTKDIKNNGPLLISMMNAFKKEFVAANALEFVNILANTNTEGISKSQLFRALGSCVTNCPPVQEQRGVFFNSAFRTINTFTDPTEYISCIETWAKFVAEYFTINDVNTLLGEINIRMLLGKAYEKHYTQLQCILDKLICNVEDLEQLLIQDNFLAVVDLFHKEPIRIDVCKNVLSTYKRISANAISGTSDAAVINALMYIGKILNDSVTALTVEDERRQISQLISHFIRMVDFGRDFEQQLSFYVDARGTFANLDAVFATLVHAVNKLAIDALHLVNGQHTRKTATFVRACIAYCFITTPSIASIQVKMDLYLLSGQVALLNNCLGQADACFEAALQLLSELPRSIEVEGKLRSTDSYLVAYLCNMLATLVVVPDSPEQGVLYLLRLLLDALKKFPFDLHSAGPINVYLHALDMLYVQSLEEFPYHIPNVVSNDELYGHDPKFLAEINNLCSQVVEQILGQLKSLGLANQLNTQATASLELFLRVVRYADLGKKETFSLATNLWLLALKQESHIDANQIPKTVKTVEEIYDKIRKCNNEERAQSVEELLRRMRIK